MTKKKLSPDERFFYKHQALCVKQGESHEEARIRCAHENAAAEAQAHDLGWYIEVEPDGTVSAWQDGGNVFDIVTRTSKIDKGATHYTNYDVVLYDANGNLLDSLGGVTFKNNDPHEPYRRVVAAELAQEALRK